jgi:hypothetical protein
MPMYDGKMIESLMAMVASALKDAPEHRIVVQSALELAYYDGRIDGIKSMIPVAQSAARLERAEHA